MFNNKILRAFTTAELLISLIIMSLTMVCSMSILFKKDKTPKRRSQDKINKAVCFNGSGMTGKPGELTQATDAQGRIYCDFELTPDMISKEFIEIRLIGAGAPKSGIGTIASAGEEKTVIYPSLQMPFTREGNGNCNIKMPACKECNDLVCNACEKGYELNGVGVGAQCEPTFVYRAYIGQSPVENQRNGGETIFAVVIKDKTKADKEVIVLETAAGGTLDYNPSSTSTTQDQIHTSSEDGHGNPGESGEVRISW